MEALLWILVSGFFMSAIAFVGVALLFLDEKTFQRMVLPLVALAAGSLVGGALFHMVPAALAGAGSGATATFAWIAAGFTTFLAMEQFIHHHHCHRPMTDCAKPLVWMILIGDGLHNFLGGLAVAGAFIMELRLGMTTWIAAAAHEVPQEVGDFGALVHGGWSKKRALTANFISALMFPLGGVIAYALSLRVDTSFLVAFAAGNFLYIGASDLLPEVNKSRDATENIVHFLSFVVGLAILWMVRLALH